MEGLVEGQTFQIWRATGGVNNSAQKSSKVFSIRCALDAGERQWKRRFINSELQQLPNHTATHSSRHIKTCHTSHTSQLFMSIERQKLQTHRGHTETHRDRETQGETEGDRGRLTNFHRLFFFFLKKKKFRSFFFLKKKSVLCEYGKRQEQKKGQ